jgi:mannose-6-phosphate isomerase-like protein (cupin superfamily)
MPIGKHNGSPNAQFWMKLAPGDVLHKHRFDNCEVLYYVNAGEGVAGAGGKTSRVRAGHTHFIPRGVEQFIANTGKDMLEVIGVYTGAGSIADGGYVHTGKVSDADLRLA